MRGGERRFKSRIWDGQGGGVGVKVVLAVASWSAPERDLSGVGPVDKGGPKMRWANFPVSQRCSLPTFGVVMWLVEKKNGTTTGDQLITEHYHRSLNTTSI
jgi:hypothetical protein